MDRSVEESTSSSNTVLPFGQSLMDGIKRIIGIFVMSEDEMSQAGIDLGNSHLSDDGGDQTNPLTEISETGQVR